MLDITVCKQNPETNPEDWSLDAYRAQENPKGSNHMIRKFINSAIYVEKPLSATSSSENTSVSYKYSNEDLLDIQTAKTKRCTCALEQKTCPCHALNPPTFVVDSKKEAVIHKAQEIKTKVSHTSISSSNHESEIAIKNWIAKKEEEKKKKEEKEKMLMEAKMKEREALLEQERNNFKKWLINKKRIEMEAKKKKQKTLEEQHLKELEKEKRQLESELNFQLWLKKKQEEQLEKKIKQQLKMINELEKKEKQLRDNDKAFNDWLKNSKDKQKPVPLNRGLETLCSSSSITYMNPNPWNPMP